MRQIGRNLPSGSFRTDSVMIPSEGAHDSNEQNVNDASKLGGEISEKAYRKAKVAGKIFFFS